MNLPSGDSLDSLSRNNTALEVSSGMTLLSLPKDTITRHHLGCEDVGAAKTAHQRASHEHTFASDPRHPAKRHDSWFDDSGARAASHQCNTSRTDAHKSAVCRATTRHLAVSHSRRSMKREGPSHQPVALGQLRSANSHHFRMSGFGFNSRRTFQPALTLLVGH